MIANTDWWCVIELSDDELANYYRWFIDREWWLADSQSTKRKYCKPPHKSHISVIRGEKPRRNIPMWNSYRKNQMISFEYTNQIRQTGSHDTSKDKFWFIDTNFPEYNIIRDFFGLPISRDNKPFNGHLTVARTHE